MKNLLKTAVAALTFAGLAACGGGGADETINKMGKLKDKLCACKDMKCAEGVMKEMSSMKEPSSKPSKAQMEKAMKIAEEMAECQKKLMSADMPPPPPPPPAPPADTTGTAPADGTGTGTAAAPADGTGTGTAAPADGTGTGTAAGTAAPATP